MTGLDLPLLLGLSALGLAAGIGITAIGPGGVLATIGLFVLTDLSPAEVAGTAIATHVATGALATVVCTRSGHLRDTATRRTAVILAVAALVGTPLGVVINSAMSGKAFGGLLATFAAGVAALVWYRDRRAHAAPHTSPSTPAWVIAIVGFAVATASAVVGVGGPMLSVPLLVALGAPVLSALAAAQVQSVVIAGVGTLGYLTTGDINWPLAAVVGIPELAGVLLGWRIARSLPTRTLKYVLIVSLVALAPYLALHG